MLPPRAMRCVILDVLPWISRVSREWGAGVNRSSKTEGSSSAEAEDTEEAQRMRKAEDKTKTERTQSEQRHRCADALRISRWLEICFQSTLRVRLIVVVAVPFDSRSTRRTR